MDMSFTELKVDYAGNIIRSIVFNEKDNYFYSLNASGYNYNYFLTRWDVETLTVQFESSVFDDKITKIIGFIENFIICIDSSDKKYKIRIFNLESNHNLNDIYNFADISIENMNICDYGKAVKIINNNLYISFYKTKYINYY